MSRNQPCFATTKTIRVKSTELSKIRIYIYKRINNSVADNLHHAIYIICFQYVFDLLMPFHINNVYILRYFHINNVYQSFLFPVLFSLSSFISMFRPTAYFPLFFSSHCQQEVKFNSHEFPYTVCSHAPISK